MTMRKNNFILLAFVLVMITAAFITGCSAPGRTPAEVHRDHYNTVQQDLWQIQDDVDAVFLLDRPKRMSDKMVR